MEQITPVNADDQMLQIRVTGTQGVDNEAGRSGNQSRNIKEEQWGDQNSMER
jgi:hypothetical protein